MFTPGSKVKSVKSVVEAPAPAEYGTPPGCTSYQCTRFANPNGSYSRLPATFRFESISNDGVPMWSVTMKYTPHAIVSPLREQVPVRSAFRVQLEVKLLRMNAIGLPPSQRYSSMGALNSWLESRLPRSSM